MEQAVPDSADDAVLSGAVPQDSSDLLQQAVSGIVPVKPDDFTVFRDIYFDHGHIVSCTPVLQQIGIDTI